MRHPKNNSTICKFFVIFPVTYTDHQLTSQRTLPRRATLQRLCGAHKRHHSTVRSILLLHTHSYLHIWMLPSSFVPCYCCNASCLLLFDYFWNAVRYLNIRHQSEHLHSPNFVYCYIKNATDMVYLNLSTSLGNVVEFGVPFVSVDFVMMIWLLRVHLIVIIQCRIFFNSCTLVSISCVVKITPLSFSFTFFAPTRCVLLLIFSF